MNKEHLFIKGIENYKKIIENELEDPNKKDILRFYKFLENKGYGLSYKIQVLRYLYQLDRIMQGKSFKKITRDDMVDFMDEIRKPREISIGTNKTVKPYSANTIRSIIGIVKVFFSWLYEMPGKTYPPCVSWIENRTAAGQVTEDDIITLEELKKLVSACKNDRDRAFLQVLYETGARISEFLDIRRKHVKFDSFGAVLMIRTSKTRDVSAPLRPVRIESSVIALEKWLKQIPDAPDQFVWTDMFDYKKRMTYDACYYALKFARKRAGIKKKIHPHIFRHSATSYWSAKGLPDGVLKKRLGWKPASKMLNRYSHITDMQSDEATLKVLGHETNGNGSSIKKKVCPRCGTENEFSNYCSRCSLPLNDNASVELIEKQGKFEKIMAEAEKDPRFGKILAILEDIMSRPPQ